MPARGGQLQKLWWTTPPPGQCVPGEEGGPAVNQGVEVASPPQRQRGTLPQPETAPPGASPSDGGRRSGGPARADYVSLGWGMVIVRKPRRRCFWAAAEPLP